MTDLDKICAAYKRKEISKEEFEFLVKLYIANMVQDRLVKTKLEGRLNKYEKRLNKYLEKALKGL